MNRIAGFLVTSVSCLLISSCGGSMSGNNCPPNIPFEVAPASATADHTATPPGNQVQFTASAPTAGVGCMVNNNAISEPVWTVSDSTDVQIGTHNGSASCVNATSGAVTVSVSAVIGVQTASGTAKLTCK